MHDKEYPKCFTYINLFNPPNNDKRLNLLSFTYYGWGNYKELKEVAQVSQAKEGMNLGCGSKQPLSWAGVLDCYIILPLR